MKNLARALVRAVAFLELSPDELVNTDAAIDAMDAVSDLLANCSDEERTALEEVLMEELNTATAADAPDEVLDFYEHFLEDFGLEEASPEDGGGDGADDEDK